ncbi:hypothetical protein CYY_008032 [Polysphondylium violaceum]|uniref:DNA topoisomerase 2 n=1 Tax=Polysphondylium violaceum TaxID=133409 RepID=A0A8J4PR07_9MYCE|nr:hypothetical protein CYY_008032 [Polysphondylium violaceum]
MSSDEDYMSGSDFDDDEFNSESDYESPKKKKTSTVKKPAAPAPKKAAAKKPAAKRAASTKKKTTSVDSDDDFAGGDGSDSDSDNVFKNITKTVKSGKSLEEIYQKKELLDQILLRPDTYIGSTERQDEELYVWQDDRMVRRKISFVPGIYKIFDEILVNAADNKQRDVPMKMIKVEIDPEVGKISVWNDGAGIPVAIHKEHNIYIPELIFGNLLTSSHYDDSEKRLTGGRNGFGAKLANIFSTKFQVECSDSKNKKLLKQTFTDNMKKKQEPVITTYSGKTDYTCITFYPELKRFGMTHMDEDLIALLTKRVYDVAGCNTSLKVSLNGKDLGIKSFEKYIALYFEPENETPIYYEKVSDRWEVAVTLSHEGQFNQVSFVNSICTVKGGTHVTHAIQNVVSAISEQVMKKNKGGIEMKPQFIKQHLFVFVNSLIENPHFDSQTKETLTSKITSFGSRCEPSEKFLKRVLDAKSGIVSTIIQWAKYKEQTSMKKTTSGGKKGKVSHPKLDDANLAGSKRSEDCTLILTEGDSAKSLAVAGISVVGKDLYGAFPLKGKLQNVRDMTFESKMNNEEINNIINIVGLQHNKKYEDVSGLRYGHIMIMADQDHDGSHIKGLVINFIHHFWPELLKMPGFLVEFITPIVKVFKKNQKKSFKVFYTLPEFLAWRKENTGNNYDIKYYKGLGTSQHSEGKEYFADLAKHKIEFEWDETADDYIDLAFNKKRADNRKDWMSTFVEGTYLDQYGVGKLNYTDFINKELILFSIADCERSIPSIVDGFKTSLRKILFSCFKRNLKKDLRVAQLIGYVSEQSAYHHGEASLYSAIVGLAQDYVGSNNINLLNPSGSFGSRLAGGKDCSQARYIHTHLQDITRAIYHPDDDAILSVVIDDGKKVQPKWYIPTIPMILVNGSLGIGTGWSSTIPCYNPRDLIENMYSAIEGKPMKAIKPWYRGFLGTVEAKSSNQYSIKGIWKQLGDYQFEVTELPVGYWTNDFKEHLDCLANPEEKKKKKEEKAKGKGKGKAAKPAKTTRKKKDDDEDKVAEIPLVKSYQNYSSESTIHFIIELSVPVDSIDVEKKFKLVGSISETNMVAFDEDGRIKKYENTAEIQQHFYNIRLQYYQKRKDFLVEKLNEEYNRLSNKARFILAVVNKELVISNVKKVDIMKKLKEMKFDKIYNKNVNKQIRSKLKGKKSDFDEEDAVNSESENEDEQADEQEAEDVKDEDSKGYDYLLSLPLWSLTMERVKKILQERDAKKKDLDVLLGTELSTIYKRDLKELEIQLDKQDAYDEAVKEQSLNLQKKSKGKTALARTRKPSTKVSKKVAALSKPAAKPAAKAAAKRKKDESDVDESDSDSDDEPKTKPVKPVAKPTAKATAKTNTIDAFLVAKKPSPPTAAKAVTVDLDDTMDLNDSLDNDLDDAFSKPTAPPAKKPAAKRAPAKKVIISDSEISEQSDDDLSEDEPAIKKSKPAVGPPAKKPAAKRAASRKVISSDSEPDVSEDESDDSDDEPVIKVSGTSSRRAQPIRVVLSDSDESD